MTKRRKISLIAGGLIVFGTCGLLFLTPASSSNHLENSLPIVAAVKVKRENLTSGITLSAELKPYQETDLHAKVAGYLKTINVDVGDQVKAGQVIAKLDIDELKDDLAHANAAYKEAKLDYDRINQVMKLRPGLLAQEEVDKSRTDFELAEANLQKAKTMQEYSVITVPFDGIVTKRYADPGALIQAGTNSSTQAMPLVHIADNTKLRLTFPVPESSVTQVKVGTPVELTVQSTGQKIKSKVARISGKIDSNTRTMETEVDIDNSDHQITPGMYASVKIDLKEQSAALTLPVQAISSGDKPDVWLIDAQNKIEDRQVKLGLQTPDRIQITEGVNEGDQIIFGSRGALKPGMKVQTKIVDNKGV